MTGVQSAFADLREKIDGTVSMPGDAGYATAVSIWNGVIQRRPAVVVSCSSTDDVVAALGSARACGLEVSVRGGGHGYAGHCVCDGGVMIDLTPMKSISVDASARRAVCGGGTTWGELDAATQEYGLAVPGGFISTTGVVGLVVDRRTNPEIARELFLSVKTIETHLRSIFRKLDVSSRHEVARVMERAARDEVSSAR